MGRFRPMVEPYDPSTWCALCNETRARHVVARNAGAAFTCRGRLTAFLPDSTVFGSEALRVRLRKVVIDWDAGST